jgi:hypothetical protein
MQKNDNLEIIKDYRPITLYNIVYGIVAKWIWTYRQSDIRNTKRFHPWKNNNG